MAVVSGTVRDAFGFTKPTGPSLLHTISSVENELESCFVTVDYITGTYAAADNANFNPAAVIQNTKRDGKTVTVRAAAFVSSGDEAGAIRGADTPSAIASNVVTHQILQEDLATERADGAMNATWNRPITWLVTYSQAV